MEQQEDVIIAGEAPPLSSEMISSVKARVVEFAAENDITLPVTLHWFELEGNVGFHNAPWENPERRERLFCVGGGPSANVPVGSE